MKDYLAKFSSTHLDGKEQRRRELSILMANLHVRSILMSAYCSFLHILMHTNRENLN